MDTFYRFQIPLPTQFIEHLSGPHFVIGLLFGITSLLFLIYVLDGVYRVSEPGNEGDVQNVRKAALDMVVVPVMGYFLGIYVLVLLAAFILFWPLYHLLYYMITGRKWRR